MEKLILNQKAYFYNIDNLKKYIEQLYNYKDKFIVVPSFIHIPYFLEKGFTVGCQNVSDEKNGSHTGEVSAKSLSELGVKYALIGHSEIRDKFKEDNLTIKNKIKKSIENDLKVILCVGESSDDREKVKTIKVIDEMLEDIPLDVIISYEPIWAIGNDIIPSSEEVKFIIQYIKSKGFKKVFYGGSVNERTISILKKVKEIDGFLIGSASKSYESVIKMIEVLS